LDKQLWLTAQPPLPEVPAGLALPVNTPRLLEETFFKDAFREEKEKVTIDNINLMYVAFTRAEDRLYIIAEPKRRNDNYYLLKELAVPLLEKEVAAGKEYTLGTPGDKEKKPAKEKAGPGIDYRETASFISNRWYDKISIRRKKPDSWGFARTRKEKRDWGELVHQVLSRIRTIEDAPAVLEKAFISGDIAAEEKEILQEKIAAILAIDAVREWFKPGLEIFNEAQLITGEGILRPDRVVISDNNAVIVDFKTGAKSMGHVNQVLKYEKALRAMGYDRVAAYLFYLDDNEIRPVSTGQGQNV
jgi:ATP-dependent exoDNAse (exonuclease V) beta subunit